MGEYRVKSGKNMPSIHGASLPSIPKIGALNRNPEPNAISEMDALSDFMTHDEPTDIRSADDILAAVGGIDGLDDGADTGYVTSENRSIAESLDSLMAMDDDMTAVSNRSSITPASEFNIPSQRVPIIRGASKGAPEVNKDEDTSKTEMVESPFMNAELAAAIAATPISKPIPIPGTSQGAAPATPSTQMAAAVQPTVALTAPSAQMAAVQQASQSAQMPAAPQATPSTQMPSAPPAAPSTQAPAAHRPAAPVPAPTPAPAAPMPQPAAPQRELSDEEQMQMLLESMTPEERMEYERYCLEQQQQEAEHRRAKQRELMEMYGNSSINQSKNSGGPVLAIVIVLILGIVGVGFYFLIFSDSSEDTAAQAEVQPEVVETPKPVIQKVNLSTYPVNIKTGSANALFINGVETKIGESYEFVSGRRNTIMAYADGMVPYFKTFDGKSDVSGTIEIDMVPDTLYLKGRIDFRLSDPSNQGNGLKAMLDGHVLSNFPSSASDVVLGRPHILTLEKPGFAKHMHLIWPVNNDTTVTIPALVPEDSALMGTKCAIKKFPPSTKPFGLKITFGDSSYSAPIVATVQPGDMIEYYITHEQRIPLQVAIIPDGFGTLNLDTALLRESIGESIVKFNSTEESLHVCMRRPGELICPDMTQETTVPSDPNWEFFGATGTDSSNMRPVRGGQGQELQSSRKYTFDVSLDAKGTFMLKQTGYDRIKKPDAK